MPQSLTLDDINPQQFPRAIQEPIIRGLFADRVIQSRIITLLLDNNLSMPQEEWGAILKTSLALHIMRTDIDELLRQALELRGINVDLLPSIGDLKFIIVEDFINLKTECADWYKTKREEWS